MTPRSQKYFFDKFIERITYLPLNPPWLCDECKPLGYCQSSKDDTFNDEFDEDEITETEKEDTVEEEKGIILKSMRDLLPLLKAHKDEIAKNAESRMESEKLNGEKIVTKGD